MAVVDEKTMNGYIAEAMELRARCLLCSVTQPSLARLW